MSAVTEILQALAIGTVMVACLKHQDVVNHRSMPDYGYDYNNTKSLGTGGKTSHRTPFCQFSSL